MEKKNNFGKATVGYLQQRYKFFVFWLVTTGVMFGIAILYQYDEVIKNMTYALGIGVFLGIMFFLYDFLVYLRRCQKIDFCQKHTDERDHFLPDSSEYQEQMYQEIICMEEDEKRQLKYAYDEKHQEMADYYTLWIHQIKTPISALQLLLQDREDTGPEQEELFKIGQYANMALGYARIQNMSGDMELVLVDVQKVVHQALKKFAFLFSRSGLGFELDEFRLEVISDEKWLMFVIEQLLSNALKYTKNGKISVYGTDADGHRSIEKIKNLVIEDTGIGIPAADIPRIFERGFTGFNGRMDKKSTGIGLYLCKKILLQLSHTIEVQSEPGVGTRVILGFQRK